MEIKRGNTVVCDVYLRDNSYTVEEIKGEHTLTLNFLSRRVVELQINDYVMFEGEKYKIRHNEKVIKRQTSLGWEYNVVFYSSQYDLLDVEFFLHGKPERKKNFDYFTGTARQWLDLLVRNMNRMGSGWLAGSCIESRSVTLSFKDKKVGTVLDELVKELDTEYWVSGMTLSIGRREYSSNGLVLGQGEGMGFTELEVSAVDDAPPITVLYPYGSDKNLGADYGSDYLLLPGGRLSIEKNVDKYGRIEKSMSFDHIYPKGEFIVTEKIDACTLKASGIDFNLTDCLLEGAEAIVTFQDGGLAGYDLAIVEGSWDNALKQFKLKENKQENALTVPGDINFAIGDKFTLTGIKMPESYRSKASEQLLEESTAWLNEHSEKRIQLRGQCDEVVFRQQNLFIACGQMVGVYSEPLKVDREIRVTKVKRYIENDDKPSYRYELTLSDFLQSNGFKDLVDDVKKFPEEIESNVRPVWEWSKRSWRDVKQTQEMMFDPDGSFKQEYTASLLAEFGHLLVGMKSQQMDLIGIKFIPNADNDANYFRSTAGRLVHFTVNENITEWTIPASSHRLNNSLYYYVYAKCSRTASTGSIYLTDQKIKFDEDTEYYHFWVGVLNTPEDGVRSWNPNYGYTEIAGQTITTGVIKDKLARLVIDLINAKITAKEGATIEGAIKFTSGSSGLNNLSEWPEIDKSITDAANAATTAKNSVTNLRTYVDGAFSDGLISEAEAKAIEKYINTVNNTKSAVEATYNKLYVNSYLSGSAKTTLLNAKTTLLGAISALISSINTAISDGKTTVAEKRDVDSKFSSFNSAMSSFNTAVEGANRAIQDALKGYSDNAYNLGGDALQAAENASNKANQANQTANNANSAASNAQSTANNAQSAANGKAKVYYSTYSPSGANVNDLWVDGKDIKRWTGSSWELVSNYDNTLTKINGGLIATGSITFGSTGGMTGSGNIRIWSGGSLNNAANATFRVDKDGKVYAKYFYAMDSNGSARAGFSGWQGNADETTALFCGSATPNSAPFRVTFGGWMYAGAATIGYFQINGNSFSATNAQISLRGGTRKRGVVMDGNDALASSNAAVLELKVGASTGSSQAQAKRWIECNGSDGWGSGFFIESRYLGDANSMQRTLIAAAHLMTHQQLYNLVGQSNTELYPVYYDARSGNFVMKY